MKTKNKSTGSVAQTDLKKLCLPAMLSVLWLCVLMPSLQAYAQNKHSQKEIIRKRINEITNASNNNKTSTASDIAEMDSLYVIAKSINDKRLLAGAGVSIMRFSLDQEQYPKVVAMGNDMEKNLRGSTFHVELAGLYRLMGLAYSYQGFFDNSYKSYRNAIRYAKKIADSNKRHYSLALSYENLSGYFEQSEMPSDSILYYLNKSLEEVLQMSEADSTLGAFKIDHIIFVHSKLGIYYAERAASPQPEMAEKHFLKALEANKAHPEKMFKINEASLLADISWFYYTKEEYNKAVLYGLQSLEVLKDIPQAIEIEINVYDMLTKSYLELGDTKLSAKYMDTFVVLTDSLKRREREAMNASLKSIVAKEQERNAQKEQTVISIALGILLTIVIIAIIIHKRKAAQERKKYELLIERLHAQKASKEATELTVTPEVAAMKEPAPEMQETTIIEEEGKEIAEDEEKEIFSAENNEPDKINTDEKDLTPIGIADETIAILLTKLKKFEKTSKFLNKDINLTQLAHQFGTNPKYLSEAIKQHSDKTFSNYINGLKIDYISQKLYQEPIYRDFKVSHLAEECGFASRQVFVLAFKKANGVTPSYFIEQLKNS